MIQYILKENVKLKKNKMTNKDIYRIHA